MFYVGKIFGLRRRASSYFRNSGFASPRLCKLVSLVRDISVIRTESEAEALIVEAKLILMNNKKYITSLYKAGKKSKVNPNVITAMVVLEQD